MIGRGKIKILSPEKTTFFQNILSLTKPSKPPVSPETQRAAAILGAKIAEPGIKLDEATIQRFIKADIQFQPEVVKQPTKISVEQPKPLTPQEITEIARKIEFKIAEAPKPISPIPLPIQKAAIIEPTIQVTVPVSRPQATFVTQIELPESGFRLTGLEFTPSTQIITGTRPFSFITLPVEPTVVEKVKKPTPIVEQPTKIEAIVVPEVKPISIAETIVSPVVVPVSVQKPISVGKTKPVFVPIADVKPISVLIPVQDVVVETKPISIPVSVPIVKPAVAPTFFPLETQPLARPSRVLAAKAFLPDIDLGFPSVKKLKPGFTFEIGRPGLETFITGEAQTFGEAVRKARRGVLETPAATLRIKQDEKEIEFQEEDVIRLIGKAFTPGKGGGVIQIARERIRSPGELLGITFKGQKARRQSLF